MEIELQGSGRPDTPISTTSKGKSSYRLRYEAEVAVLRREFGGLEHIRQKLGLSRRQICQLLMVDPSAWTRWTRDESKVPPHVYRLLQTLLAEEDGRGSMFDPALREKMRQLEGENLKLANQIDQLHQSLVGQRNFTWGLVAVAGVLGLIVVVLQQLA